MVVVQSGAQRMADKENVERQKRRKRGFKVEGAGRSVELRKAERSTTLMHD
jgi:hypothetical protein